VTADEWLPSSDRPGKPTGTWVARALHSRLVVGIGSQVPVPLALARAFLLHDNRQENRLDGWARLRAPSEQPRYRAVRSVVEKYGSTGFVLDVGCSQGVLQEGLAYGRYLGVDAFAEPIAHAAHRSDVRTSFVHADGAAFVPDQPPDVVVLNEVLYYLPDPLASVRHYASVLSPGGVLVVSVFERAWATRRLLRQIARQHSLVESSLVGQGHLCWRVSVFRP